MGVSLTLLLVLVLSCLQKPDTTGTYEKVRWLLALAMLLLGVHYLLQMWFGFRAQGDDVGTVVNILFYSPVTYIMSYSILRIGCGRGYHRKFLSASVISMVLILSCFAYGYLHYGSLHMQEVLYVMGLIYLLTVVFFIVYPIKEIRRVRKWLTRSRNRTNTLQPVYAYKRPVAIYSIHTCDIQHILHTRAFHCGTSVSRYPCVLYHQFCGPWFQHQASERHSCRGNRGGSLSRKGKHCHGSGQDSYG